MNQLSGRTRKEYITFTQQLCSLSGKLDLVAYVCRARKGCVLVALQLKEARGSFFGLRVEVLKLQSRIQDKL